MICFLCRSNNMRLSRIRLADLPRLLQLEFPVRCRNCFRRTFVKLGEAWPLITGKKASSPRNGEGRPDGLAR